MRVTASRSYEGHCGALVTPTLPCVAREMLSSRPDRARVDCGRIRRLVFRSDARPRGRMWPGSDCSPRLRLSDCELTSIPAIALVLALPAAILTRGTYPVPPT